ncbi:uncharacterized protein LOC120271892 [Dioscorea cayenensis subsp. rotundata]|uniref:Uncharacterized protein LOC120271892 n=1 Tax=Dioscorea cayennensis subsp. rotundata TaxID=55577 RepID=A0AB40C838_DIOCR|nr:uncharacterized protein LOC120271892 [Dioscorea cayenensis subsp. rotundata]
MVPSTLSPLINPSFHRRNPSRPILSSPPPPRSPARRFRCAAKPSGRSWDSNAEFFRTRRFEVRDDPGWGFWKRGRRRWWSDEAEFDDDVDDDDDDDDDEIDQPWERIWIFKVFKAYGFLLPAIIASMLLATGPKAFLMALALPLGQSALSLAFEKVWGNSSEGERARQKTKEKPFRRSTSASDFKWRDEEDGAQGYRSWVSGDVGMDDQGDDVVSHPPRSFGGWDELDRQEGSTKRTTRRHRPITMTGSSSENTSEDRGKLSGNVKYRDAPLFLRLLIAVFPFLGSWTRML